MEVKPVGLLSIIFIYYYWAILSGKHEASLFDS